MFSPRGKNPTPKMHRARPYPPPLGNFRSPGPSSPGGFSLPTHTRYASSPVTPRRRYRAEGGDPFTPSPRPIRLVPRTPHRVGGRGSPPHTPRTPHTPKPRVVSSPAKLPDTSAFEDLTRDVRNTASRVRKPLPDEERTFLKQFSRLHVTREIVTGLAVERERLENVDVSPAEHDTQLQEDVDLAASFAAKEEEERRRRLAEVEAERRLMEETRAREEEERRKQEAEEEQARQDERRGERERAEQLARLKQQREEASEMERREAAALEAKRKQKAREMEVMRARREAARLQEERDALLREARQAAERAQEEMRRTAEDAKARAATFRTQMEAIRLAAEQAREESERYVAEEAVRARELAEMGQRLFQERQALLNEQARAQAEEVLRQARVQAEQEATRQAEDLRRRAAYEVYRQAYDATASAFARAEAEVLHRLQAIYGVDANMYAEQYQQRQQQQRPQTPEYLATPTENPHSPFQQRQSQPQNDSYPFHHPQPEYHPHYQPQQAQPESQYYPHYQYQQKQPDPRFYNYQSQGRAQYEPDTDVPMRGPSIYFDKDASMASIPADEPPSSPISSSPPPSSPPQPTPPPRPSTPAEWFSVYEAKWEALKAGVFPWNMKFEYLPWPVFHDVSGPEDITNDRLLEFFTHPDRPPQFRKGKKELRRTELLRWHPDKFMFRVQDGVDANEVMLIHEAIRDIARFLISFTNP